MINFQRKEECCGCGACYDACNHNAIEWQADEEGFSYPSVNQSLCVDCGLCNRACPIENKDTIAFKNKGYTPLVYGVYHKDENIQFTSTSGGAFWGLAEEFVKQGGYVSGAIFYNHFHIKHYITNDLEELRKIKGSKYAQSDCRGVYKEIRKLLIAGEKVMATGLPCQIAALYQYLHKEYENLITVDLICHSVASPMVFEKYIDYLEKTYSSSIVNYHPKNKEYGGWYNFAFKATFENGEVYHKNGNNDKYTRLFVGSDNLCTRYSCFECPFKNVPQPSDLTIGDFWGIDVIDPSLYTSKGISKLVANSEKGEKYFKSLNNFEYKQYTLEESIFNNPPSWTMLQPAKRPSEKRRKSFIKDINRLSFDKCVLKYCPDKKSSYLRVIIFRIINYVRKLQR